MGILTRNTKGGLASALGSRTGAEEIEGLLGGNQGVVSVLEHGADVTGQRDSTAAIQAAASLARGGAGVVYLPPGRYTISDSIYLTTGDSLETITVTGAGGGYAWETRTGTVQIYCTFTDRPAFIVQGGRNVTIRGIEFLGQNLAPGVLTSNRTDINALTDDPADWTTAGCSNGRYNPYCAIAVDPYSGTKPGSEFYPTGDYGKSGSTNVAIEDCTFRRFVAGVAIKPSDDDNNGDHVRLNRNTYWDCVYGVSIGNSQARGVTIFEGHWQNCMVCVECGTHGKRIGAPPMLPDGSAHFCHTLFRFSNAIGDVSIDGFYAESIKSIGYFGTATASQQHAASVTGSHFKFRNFPGENGIFPNDAAIHLRTFMPTAFVGCTFNMQRGALNVAGNANDVGFDNCAFITINPDWDDQFLLAVNDAWAAPKVVTRGSLFRTNFYSTVGTKWNCPDTESQVTTIPARFDLSAHSRKIYGPQYSLTVENAGAAQGVSGRTRVSSTGSSYSWTGDTLTFTAAAPEELLVGDKFYWLTKADAYASSAQFLVPALVVTNISGSTITAVSFVGTDNLDLTYTPASVGLIPRNYAFGAAVTGTVTSASTSITGVTSASSYFRAGDWIAGTGIPAKTRVTNVSGTTVTISKAATATNSNVALYFDHAWRDDVPLDSAEAFFAARNTTTDDAKSIMACAQYWGRCQLLAGSAYAVSTTIDMPANSELVGANHQGAILRATTGFVGPVVQPNSRCTVRDLFIDGLDEATSIGLKPGTSGGNVLCDRVAIANFAEGLVIDGSGAADFTFRNGRVTSCTSNNIRIGTTGMSKVTIADNFIQSSTGPGILVSGATNALTISGNDIASNGTYGIQSTASSLSTTIRDNHFQSNTTADVLVSGNSRALLFEGNNCTGSPICFTASNGTGGSIQANTFNPSGGTTKSITLTNSAATRYTIGQNVYLAGAFAYGTDNSGTQTRYLGQIFSNAAPTGGTWEVGEVVWDISPTSGSAAFFVCTVAGTPGTWVSGPNLA